MENDVKNEQASAQEKESTNDVSKTDNLTDIQKQIIQAKHTLKTLEEKISKKSEETKAEDVIEESIDDVKDNVSSNNPTSEELEELKTLNEKLKSVNEELLRNNSEKENILNISSNQSNEDVDVDGYTKAEQEKIEALKRDYPTSQEWKPEKFKAWIQASRKGETL